MLKVGSLVLVIAACSSGPKSSSSQTMPMTAAAPPPPSECQVVAKHVAEVILTFPKAPKAAPDAVADALRPHCESDGWSADAKQCLGAITDEPSANACLPKLTEAQRDAVMKALDKFTPDDTPAESPAPMPEGAGGGASDGGGDGADPCQGGE